MAIGNVVIVPGILASKLQTAPGRKLVAPWTDPNIITVNGIDDLELDATGTVPGRLATFGPLFASGLIGEAPYAPLIDQLADDGWAVSVFAYDWRLTLPAIAGNLSTYLMQNFGGREFHVVAHSLGGLVARWAWSLFRVAADPTTWMRTAYMATPHGGSYDSPAHLAGWIPPLSQQQLVTLMGGALLRRLVRPVAPLTSAVDRYKEVVATWPSSYELLPVNAPDRDWADSLAGQLDLTSTWTAQNEHVTATRLSQAATVRNQLLAMLDAPRPSEVCIVGEGYETRGQLAKVATLNQPAGYTTTLAGDGVVTTSRATLAGTPLLTVTSAHQAVPYHSEVLRRITDLLLDPPPGPVVVPPPFAKSPAIAPAKFPALPPAATWDALQIKQDP